MDEIQKLIDARVKLIQESRAILDKADAEKRHLTAEETTQFEKLKAETRSLEEQISKAQKEETERRTRREWVDAEERRLKESAGRKVPPTPTETRGGDDKARTEYRALFQQYLRGNLTRRELEHEARTLKIATNTAGGYLLTPTELYSGIIEAMDNMSFIRQLATKATLDSAISLGVPSRDTDVSASTWTTEVASVSEDTNMTFGRRTMTPNVHKKRIKVSKALLQRSPMDMEAYVRTRIAYQINATEENAYLNGNGSGRPLGLFVADAAGINTDRDTATASTTGFGTSAGALDCLITAKKTLKQQYQNDPALRWVMHRDIMALIMKIRDTTGQYIYQPSLVAGQPDRLIGVPVIESEYAPNTLTAGLYVALLGVISNYMIVDVQGVDIQRLDELYAETSEVGFLAERWVDGQPTLAEAFVRIKTAAA